MSNFDVIDGDMPDRRLTDADIEALISGRPVAGAPAQLTELLAALRDHTDTDVPVSAALNEFFVTGTPSGTHSTVSGEGGTVLVLRRRRVSSLVKAASVVGLVPVPLVIGATMAAAAALGGAHMAGVVDVPLLPDRTAQIEVIVPIMPRTDSPPPTGTSRVAGQHPRSIESRDADATPIRPTAVASTRPQPGVESVPTDREPAATALPDGAAVQGRPGSDVGQETSEPQNPPSTPTTVSRTAAAHDPDIDRSVDPSEQTVTPAAPVPHSDNGEPDGAGATASAPHNGGQPPVAVPPVASPPVSPEPGVASSVTAPPVTPPSVTTPPTNPVTPRTP